jgi:hypothetical protein
MILMLLFADMWLDLPAVSSVRLLDSLVCGTGIQGEHGKGDFDCIAAINYDGAVPLSPWCVTVTFLMY